MTSLPLQDSAIRHIVRRKWYDIVTTAGGIDNVTQYEIPCNGSYKRMVQGPGTENDALVGELTVTSAVKDWKQPKLRIKNVINNNMK